MIDVIPSIFEQEWGQIERKISFVAPFVEWVQIDIADGTLVPAKTFLGFEKFRTCPKNVFLEGHLMVAKPESYIRSLVDAGFRRLIAHVEADDPRLFLESVRFEEVEVGLAIDSTTEIELIEPFFDQIDCVLVMTVEAGASGQPIQSEAIEKIRVIHEHVPDIPIEVEGGMNQQTAGIAREAGAVRLVSSSFLFKDTANIGEAIDQLKGP